MWEALSGRRRRDRDARCRLDKAGFDETHTLEDFDRTKCSSAGAPS